MHPFVADLAAAIETQRLLPDGAACVIAVSGGRDSMTLLHGLAALGPLHGWRFVVAHFHHQLRGLDADADQALVADAAAMVRLPFVSGTANPRNPLHEGDSLEAVARRLRHGFLARTAHEHDCQRVATAHHAEDQLELFLMRLLRGAGGSGLAGMSPDDPSPADSTLRLVRPLLGFSGIQLAAAAREIGVTWREDASNRDLSLLRNRVRHELIPLLEARFQPGLKQVLRREQAILRDQAAAVEHLARCWLASPVKTDFTSESTAVQREIVHLQLEAAQVTPSFQLIEALRLDSDSSVQIDPHRAIFRDGIGRLQIETVTEGPGPFSLAENTVTLGSIQGECEFGGVQIHWRFEKCPCPPTPGAAGERGSAPAMRPGRESERSNVSTPGDVPSGADCPGGWEAFDAGAVASPVTLRHWRPGDRFRPIGLNSAAKLQDLFTNAGIPAAHRRRLVLAETADGEVFWVEGLRIGERAKRTPATRDCLIWRWSRHG